MLQLFLTLIITITVIREGNTCPKNWLRFSGSCFAIIQSKNTWADASVRMSYFNMICEQIGGYLAEIDSEMKALFIKTIIKDNNLHTFFVWLGGNDLLFEGNWIWSKSNLPLNYTDWCRGQPSNIHNQDCMAIGSTVKCDEGWYDEQCEKQYSSLCEMKDPSVTVIG